eukprot:UN29671
MGMSILNSWTVSIVIQILILNQRNETWTVSIYMYNKAKGTQPKQKKGDTRSIIPVKTDRMYLNKIRNLFNEKMVGISTISAGTKILSSWIASMMMTKMSQKT